MGGGGSKSKTTNEIITDVITNVAVSDMQNCATYIAQSQSVDVTGSGNIISNVTMVQGAQINMDCYRQSRNIIDLQNAIKNQLTQATKTRSSGIPSITPNNSAAFNKMLQSISTNITMDMLQNCASAVNQSQTVQVAGERNIVQNVAMQQTATMLKSCMSNSINRTTLGNDIANFVAQSATTDTSLFGGLFDALGGVIGVLLIVGGLVVVLIIVVILYYSGVFDDDVDDASRPATPI